jgi:hypothetical protein
VALLTADRAVRPGGQLEAEIVGGEAGGEKAERVVASLAIGAELGGHVIDRLQLRRIEVDPVAADARERRSIEGAVAQVTVAFLARDGRVPPHQREAGAPMSIGSEQGRSPLDVVVAAFAVQAKLTGVPIAVTAGTGVGDVDVEVLAVTLPARHPDMRAMEWKSRLFMIEANIGPGALDVTGGAIDLARGQAMHAVLFSYRSRLRFAARCPTRQADHEQQQRRSVLSSPHGSNPRNSPL